MALKSEHNTGHYMSISLEDYIMTIYKIIQEKKGVKAIDISRRLGVGRSSVTDALKNLAEKQLINYNPYDVISLTDKGEEIAADITKKHAIMRNFFENILTLSPEEAEKNACKVSHLISEEAFDKFAQFVSKVVQ